MKFLLVGAELFHVADRRTDRTKLIDCFIAILRKRLKMKAVCREMLEILALKINTT
jgi:hypothetical protein